MCSGTAGLLSTSPPPPPQPPQPRRLLLGFLRQGLVAAETEKRSLSSADFPAGSVEEHWIKEIGKMFEVRLEQLRANLNLTDELLRLA
jgi:hypothetical protein